MSLFGTPEEHAANPPDSWVVAKEAERSWTLKTAGGETLGSFNAKHKAEDARTGGFLFSLYQTETRWYAGESIPSWKPYAQIVAENARREAWLARKGADTQLS